MKIRRKIFDTQVMELASDLPVELLSANQTATKWHWAQFSPSYATTPYANKNTITSALLEKFK